jgi:hypothetical protein
MLPFGLLGTMAALALGAALLGIFGGPTLAAINLQIAVARTAAEPSFTFHVSNTVRQFAQKPTLLRDRSVGTWQAPDRLSLRSSSGDQAYGSSVTITIGTHQYQSHPNGGADTIDISPFVANSLSIADGPIFGLPPLGAAATATNVTHHGDRYSFVVPHMTLPIGWVAYAPLSQKTSQVHFPVAVNTPMTATIRNGLIVQISFPHGIHGNKGPVLGKSTWTLSNFGTAPAIQNPT